MVRSGAGALLAADRDATGVEQAAEEFPPCRRLEHRDAALRRHSVGGAAGRHGARDALQAAGIALGQMDVGRQHREAVRGRHGYASAQHDVAIAIAVGRGAHVGSVGREHQAKQPGGINYFPQSRNT